MRSVMLEYEAECSVFSTPRNIQGTESATRLPTRTDLVVEARRHGEGRAKARKILEGCHPHANLRRLPPDDEQLLGTL